ncbi:Acyl-CoA synthetase (AMP-forming)/AMP-acid ligase II [Saccharopolyspora kobensis]|uniref:Acyl-CoA synthetase (AMP-forming)/AMP-acid ligase II n=1 Tax=Saccharopolyspora kobensis TaxID=146035 RepID=A0A1H5VZB4_9PSEU|nr:class I adenylate-forming enzyme family protein [Saccharopolyspora kobensis]SEF92612.1 Acyl-CoA synthetase (AMP-forming)/AMP-acid ligase II [Saccharopolyspora kobensis]SFC54995.1 Acyl-CoA synthetase (AMP-forming)/AMP-acid ligase II [Saccharopolyspora kobensis]
MSTIDPDTAAPASALTGPGGEFELVEQDVLGTRLPVFRNRARSLAELVAASARHGDRDYIVTEDRRISFRRHADQVAALATALREEYGVGRGDRVAIAAANAPEWILAFWAAMSVGAVAVGCNAWWSARELDHGVRLTEPSLIVADTKRAALLTGSPVPLLPLEQVDELAQRYAGAPMPAVDVAEDDPAIILFTSGTSGRPKGAVHSHRNVCSVIEYHRMNDALAAAHGDPIDPRDRRYLLALPLFHIACLHNLAVPRLATGSTVVMHQGSFDVDRVLRLVARERVTNWGAVPTQAHRILEHGDISQYDLSSLTTFSLASAPSSAAFKQRLRERLPVAERSLVDSYGMTETCTALTAASPADLAEAPETLGRPIAGVQLEIRDPFGNALPDGQEGEVCVRSAYNMLGYWNDPRATADAIRADRWLHTGDIGVIEHGRLRLSARRSDLIIRGGENVYPAEVEGVLAEHPDVQECAVLGVSHPDLGQEVFAVVVIAPGSVLTEQQLHDYARERLAHFKVPSRWRITQEPLPRNATGKVVRTEVRPTA